MVLPYSLLPLLLLLLLRLHPIQGLVASPAPVDLDLACLREFLHHTTGAVWSFANSTSSAPPPCTPLHPQSSKLKLKCEITTGDVAQLRITVLMLEGMNLQGTFPPSHHTLGNLSALCELSLFNNSLRGPLPPELWRLSGLSYLSLSQNLFSGTISPGLSSLSNLVRLDLSHNNLSGPLLAEQFASLTKLRYLYLSFNKFIGALPDFMFTFSNLIELNLARNALQGSLPTPVPSTVAAPLSNLDLSHNNLSGSSSFLQYMPFLSRLDLSYNSFDADAPTLLGDLPSSLLVLDLSSNKLTGNPSLNVSHLPLLSHLGLGANQLIPSTCEWILSLRLLQYLNLSQCHVMGAIPGGIGNLTNLTQLDLSFNELNGGLPFSLTSLHSLTYLDLSNNNLSGDPSVFSGMKSLLHLNYSFNNPKTGCVPQDVRDRFGLNAFEGLCQPLAIDALPMNPTHSRGSKAHLAILLSSLAAGVVALCCCMFAAGFLLHRRKMPRRFIPPQKSPLQEKYVSGPFSFETDSGMWLANVKNPSTVPVVILEKPLLNLTFADLLHTTSNFSKESQLTEGGFGPVYRATLHGDLDVTIKVLIEGRILTDQEAADEFRALSKIKHPNLVPLLGYCIVGDERLVIYRHIDNGGLHRWLHELPLGTQLDDWSRDLQWEPVSLDMPVSAELGFWDRRHKIALGIARALAFLHHGHSPQIVHRDVKASNVMLDMEFEPYLANTGLVGLLAASDDGLFAGSTPGYAPPEYQQPGCKVSVKGDVYSYGVVLLELVTGKRPVGDNYQDGHTGNLVSWVRLLMKEKRAHRALDPRISPGRGPITVMIEALRIGYLCTAEQPYKRPTMQQIVGLLKDMEPSGSSP